MKDFAQYLTESVQTYEFKIKIADMEMDDDVQTRIEHALKAFDLDRISKPKKLPYEKECPEFPNMGIVDVYLINVAVKYPCNNDQLRTTIASQARIPLANIYVYTKGQDDLLLKDETTEKAKEAVLTKELEQTSSDGQEQVGTKRISNLLKELESMKHEFADPNKEKAKASDTLPQGTASPVGSKK